MACGVEQWIQYFFFQKKANICTIDKLFLIYSFEIPPLLNSKFLHKTLPVSMFCLVMYLLMPTSHTPFDYFYVVLIFSGKNIANLCGS